ncbi:MAG: IS66 family transposase [Desulfuromusa sp.]|nr:IS66 family transposase [Desulfuromusa sp.]
MENSQLDLPESKGELTQIIISNVQEIERLEEEVRLLRQLLFAPKSEKLPVGKFPQLSLFDMPENLPEVDDTTDTIVVPEHTRTKKKGRKKLPDNLPRFDRVHDIPEEDKICGCGCELSKIGEDVSEKLDIEPAKIRVIRHIRPKYACKNCEGLEDDTSVKIAPVPPQIIPKGLPTAGLLAHILVAKFCDALPFYRQEKQFIRLDIDIPRQSMCNWAMKAACSCQVILDLLGKEIRSGPLLNIDETTIQVLKEPGRSPTTKSYMWVFRGGETDNPVVLFQYHPTRSGDVAKLFVDDYQGVIQTDGYAGYNFLDGRHGVLHVGCWAHARRKFMDVRKGSVKGKSHSTDNALSMIRNLYKLEKIAKNDKYTPDELYDMRQKQAKPILNKFKSWLDKRKDSVPPKTLLGKAVNYCLNQWPRLERYVEDGNAGIDNNVAENAIRPFVLGRKNWLFSGTPDGAEASALLYSLIETAKANELEPYAYLRFLFEKLPTTTPESIEKLLPTRLSPEDLILTDLTTGV